MELFQKTLAVISCIWRHKRDVNTFVSLTIRKIYAGFRVARDSLKAPQYYRKSSYLLQTESF